MYPGSSDTSVCGREFVGGDGGVGNGDGVPEHACQSRTGEPLAAAGVEMQLAPPVTSPLQPGSAGQTPPRVVRVRRAWSSDVDIDAVKKIN
jgi:hypothetical protein